MGGWLVGRAGGGGGAQADEGGKQQGLSEMVVGEVKEKKNTAIKVNSAVLQLVQQSLG